MCVNGGQNAAGNNSLTHKCKNQVEPCETLNVFILNSLLNDYSQDHNKQYSLRENKKAHCETITKFTKFKNCI